MANYLVTIATTVYNTEVVEADSRDEAYLKGQEMKVDYSQGDVYETPYVENIELLN